MISENKTNLYSKEYENKWGFQDSKGNWIIAPIYENAYAFSEGLAPVKKDELHPKS